MRTTLKRKRPNSFESGRPSISPPPKAAHIHPGFLSALWEWLRWATVKLGARVHPEDGNRRGLGRSSPNWGIVCH